ncbi:unnamed protein product [Lepeophtheirus salmonis]|uniref:(salmon louse) hypothetical protein n=1 Tax=Lepeophtheirus salmonis TaxID=72036 RepID=A0A7R8CJL4_LEPSM|nr:unnamed protein product [Lepeophtheirus salmonis]CAF2793987.1 unnamed protein product [Lepeophtheirus salmonis]
MMVVNLAIVNTVGRDIIICFISTIIRCVQRGFLIDHSQVWALHMKIMSARTMVVNMRYSASERVLFNDGSQTSLIYPNLARTLKFQGVEKRFPLLVLTKSAESCHRHEISLRSIDNSLIPISAFKVERMSDYTDPVQVDIFNWPHLKLGYSVWWPPSFYVWLSIDMLPRLLDNIPIKLGNID